MQDKRADISNLDFISIKSSLINFLSNQEEFKGYSFEGSAMNILMDLLAYNTYYNGMYNNLVMNESFLDTASKRSSIVSLAKNLGYTPRSSKTSTAVVNIKLPAEEYTDAKSIIQRNTVLTALNSAGSNISFTTTGISSLESFEIDEDGEILSYAATNVEIKQGVYNTFSHIATTPEDKINIPFNGIDISTIRAFVLSGIGDTTGIQFEWTPVKNITDTNENSRVFFINEMPNGFYQIQFGDGSFGKKLEPGNVVLFEFLLTSGAAGNDIGINDTSTVSSFSLSGYEVETVQYSTGGSDRETLESIRQNSLRNYSTQDRAVTATDYEAIILKSFGSVESVRCWGGEDNDPPEYGKLYASIKPLNAPFLTASEKASIVENLILNKSTVGITVQILDPDILYLNLNINVKYDPSTTTDTETKIKNVIEDQTKEFSATNYIGFDDDFYASEFVSNALGFHPSIVALNVEAEMEKRIYPTAGINRTFVVDFENEIYHPEKDFTIPSISSSSFYYTIEQSNALVKKLCYIEDDNGILKLYYEGIDTSTGSLTKVFVAIVGTVDYTTGRAVITLNINSFSEDGNYIAIMAKPKDTDVFTDRDTTLSFDRLSNRNVNVELKKVYRNTVQNSSSANRTYNR